jgi:protein SCO1/2
MKQTCILPHIAFRNTQRRLLDLYRVIWMGLALTVFAVIGAGYWIYHQKVTRPSDPPGVQTLVPPEVAPDFNLTDQLGRPFSQTRLLGRWTIMFFGYSHCPDFCPTSLAALNRAYRRLERDLPKIAATTQVVFVSVDPFRDSPPILAEYVGHFNARFIGVTGPPAQLQRLTQPLGASYDYADPRTGVPFVDPMRRPQGDYTVDHGSGFYIFDDRARIVAWILPPHTADRIVSVYTHIRSQYEQYE